MKAVEGVPVVEKAPARRPAVRKSGARKTVRSRAKAATPANHVAFRELDRGEIEAMLLRNKVGRIAFSFHDRVDIQPIHYIYERGWLYGRTSEGDKISTLKHNQWVAFEIDEITDTFDWRSIVIHGSLWLMHPRGSPRAEELWTKAAGLMAMLVPDALTENDPVAFRQVLFRIAISDVRGREASTRPSPA